MLLRCGAKNAKSIANPFLTENVNTVLTCRPNSEYGSFSELLLIPKAQDAMTSVVNLAIISFTSTVEPDNSPLYCNCQDLHLLIVKFQHTLTLSLSSQTFSATQIIESSISKLVLMLLVCQNSIINIALFERISLTAFNLHIKLHNICHCILYNILYKQLFLALHYLSILHIVNIYHTLNAALMNVYFKKALP